ncbi:MAG TPA: helix-turn-helix domain-containing protein [Actinocrinis sp.]
MSSVEPLFYTPQQASKRLGKRDDGKPIKSANWLKDQVRASKIPHTKLGKTIAFSQRDLDELVELLHRVPRNKLR